MVGISSYGGYVPRYRLNRFAVFGAMGWLAPALLMNAQGEKAVANYDEDALTMAVSAGITCLDGFDLDRLDAVYFASTTSPYRERQCAGIVAGALCAREEIRSADFSGSVKAGTGALLAALEFVSANGGSAAVCAGDNRLGKMGSVQEMYFGDGGAAMLVSDSDVVAEYKGSFSVTHDFVDHLRGADSKFDRQWEERWIRDEGYQTFIPQVIQGLFDKYGLTAADFAKVVYPCYYGGARKTINTKLGFEPDKVVDDLSATVGDTGAAHPLLMLSKALEEASPGDRILLLGYGNGCDALFFEVTGAIENLKPRDRFSRSLANRCDLDSYVKYLVWRDMAPAELGIRGEDETVTRWTLFWRNHKAINSLEGCKCRACGAQQYPPQVVCANPECGAIGQMDPVYLSHGGGTIFSYTSDLLAASLNPPAIYGTVQFNGGGRTMMDFTDCVLEDLSVGMPVDFSFRRKFHDASRDISFYFWKAVPANREVI